MDLDAEMEKLKLEARRHLEERERQEQETALPPTPFPEEVKQQNAVDATAAPLLDLPDPRELARQAARRAIRNQTEERLKDSVVASKMAGWSWQAKIATVLGGLLAVALLWSWFLKPLLAAAIGLALLVLIIVAIWKLARSGNKDDDAE